MISRNKEIMGFIAQLTIDLKDMDSETKKIIIIKTILLKWLIDHYYIQWNYFVYFSLLEEFTLGNILCSWGGINIDFHDKNHKEHFSYLWDKHSEFILGNEVLSTSNSNILGEIYEYLNNMESKKKRGMYYTPASVIEFMLRDGMDAFNEKEKMIDPACGCGFFLSTAYDLLMEHYTKTHPTNNNPLKIHRLLLEDQLFGMDIDPLGVHVTKLILLLKQPRLLDLQMNIYCQDALLDDNEKINGHSFRLVMGNPPYIGHKKLDRSYKLQLKQKYHQVYHDKGDISYCFFQQGLHLLKPGGHLIFIVSRYFLEALHGAGLREFIHINTRIVSIVDFYGQRILKGIGVDPLIIHLTKDPSLEIQNWVDVTKLKIIRKKLSAQNIFEMIRRKEENSCLHSFSVLQNQLSNDGWRLLHPIAQSIIEKIERACSYRLENVFHSKQGIITGKDKAFIFQDQEIQQLNINKNLLKPWLKGKNISPYFITNSYQKLCYTNDIHDIEEEEGIFHHLMAYKDLLSKRRECEKGLRKWYELQWGREKDFFESDKIIFPYKANANKFALDRKGYYYSADVYGLQIKKECSKKFSYYSCIVLLNSKIYDFYFKGFGKKLGDDLYEYYPNTVLRMAIPELLPEEEKYLDGLYLQIQDLIKKENTREIENIKDEADKWIMNYYHFTVEEKEFIMKHSSNKEEEK